MSVRTRRKPGFQTATLFAGVILLLILFAVVGYFFALTPLEEPTESDPQRVELAENQRRWSLSKPRAFSYTIEITGRRGSPLIADVIVINGLRTVRYGDSADAGDERENAPVSINYLFELTKSALTEADSTSVLYDEKYGFPSYLSIDWDNTLAQDEDIISVRLFVPVDQNN